MSKERKQPVGVTIIGIFGIIVGIVSLIVGIGIVLLGPIINDVVLSNITNNSDSLELSDLNGTSVNGTDINFTNKDLSEFRSVFSFMYYLGLFLIPYGIAVIVIGWGLLRGKGWAWLGAIILIIIDIVATIVLHFMNSNPGDISNIIGSVMAFIIDGVILWYLFRINVKAYFGRVKMQAP